jgi:K+-sensing histidine kinase KdpD
MGNAEYLASENSESKAKKVQQKAEEIEQMSSEIRTDLDIFEQARKEPDLASLHTILEECVRSVGREYASVNIKYEARFDDCNVNSILSKVLYNLIENAAQYNTSSEPKVWIEVTVNSDRVQISIRDNGPGIEHEELALMENKTETPLEHGSGFGLAIAMWGTELADGQITFEEREPTGLSVSVEVPILAETDSGEDASSGGVNWNSIATEQF